MNITVSTEVKQTIGRTNDKSYPNQKKTEMRVTKEKGGCVHDQVSEMIKEQKESEDSIFMLVNKK